MLLGLVGSRITLSRSMVSIQTTVMFDFLNLCCGLNIYVSSAACMLNNT